MEKNRGISSLSILIIIAILIIGGIVLSQRTASVPLDTSVALAQGCEESGGEWLSEYNECEYGSAEWCQESSGEFLSCESVCRHNPDPNAICTEQCVAVCVFQDADVQSGIKIF
ncbi:hypothetical protein COB64_02550 [Candidatus Wolfebacteria bacterium]|nr:MAG: hypothetical protein COB64_02550 [Candidatus Wolfebacteria bacterium]